jgi:hypothetical protein
MSVQLLAHFILVKKAISTNLISTKNFSGMAAPIKIGVTAHCRAYKNVDLEVRQPLNQLSGRCRNSLRPTTRSPAIFAVFPSGVPQILGMKYADMLIAPIVIESIPSRSFQRRNPRAAGALLSKRRTLTQRLSGATSAQVTNMQEEDASLWKAQNIWSVG